MRWLLPCLGLLLAGLTVEVEAGSAKIMKVLPHLLDAEGRHTASPSLYDRDAYQAYLRKNPTKISALRFDINWKSTLPVVSALKLQIEVRGSRDAKILVLDQAVKPLPWYKRWTAIKVDPDTYRRLGEVVAWRATLWDGQTLLAEQRSFLW